MSNQDDLDDFDPVGDVKNALIFLWGLTLPGAIINIAKRSREAEKRQNGAVYGVVLGSAPTDSDGPGEWERYNDPRNEIAYRKIIRPARKRG